MSEKETCETLDAYKIDDGTLDTVFGCKNCDWIGRYNNEKAVPYELWALEEDHHEAQIPYRDIMGEN